MKLLALVLLFSFTLFSCATSKHIILPKRKSTAIKGNQFYKSEFAASEPDRELLAKNEILSGIYPLL